MTSMKQRINRAFMELGRIDKSHASGRITKRVHDVRSRRVLKRLVKK